VGSARGNTRLRRASRRVGAVGVAVAVSLIAPVSCVAPPDLTDGTTVRMDLTLNYGFFAMPWPNEIRTTPTGTLDVNHLPGVDSPILRWLLALAGNEIGAAGTDSAAYLQLSGPVDPSSLPDPVATSTPNSPVLLVDLDHGGRSPALVRIEPMDQYRPANLLSVMPYPGHPLRGDTRYAVVVTDGVRGADGSALQPAPVLTALDAPRTSDGWIGRSTSPQQFDALRAQHADVVAALADNSSWGREHLVGFTVFRTQDVQDELDAVAATTARLAAPAPTFTQRSAGCESPTGDQRLYGHVDLPLYQQGFFPFSIATWGGHIQHGPDGSAVVQRVRSVPLEVHVPCGATPVTGWPILTFINGTGAGTGGWPTAWNAAQFLTLSIPPLFGAGSGSTNADGDFYNFLNPGSTRVNPVQQAADNLALLRIAEELGPQATSTGAPIDTRTDPSIEVISGQSQGAQTLPLVATAKPSITAMILGAGGGLYGETLAHKTALRGAFGAISGTTAGLDLRSPPNQVIQTLLEASDPVNFPSDTDVLNFAGLTDGCVPLEASRALATSLGLTVLNPQYGSIHGTTTLDAPTSTEAVSGNRGGRTAVSLEVPGGHDAMYTNGTIGRRFLQDLAARRRPTVDPAGAEPAGSLCIGDRLDAVGTDG